MDTASPRIRAAVASDLGEVLALLTAVGLPHEGVREHLGGFFVAHDGENQLLACAGLERYGPLALLRSVAVSPESRHHGLGTQLTTALLTEAAKAGIEEVVLLTITKKDFFARQFGFVEADRAGYHERLVVSPEWSLPRCTSAVFMRLALT